MSEFKGEARPLADSDFESAAAKLVCEVAAIRAVAKVEAGGRSGFLADGRPKILFESRWFHKLTGGRHDRDHGDISTPTWVRNYKGGAGEYERLAKAMTLDREAALKSASWGMFQILGVNHNVVGFDNVEDYVRAQCVSEGEHLKAFVNFVISNRLDDELRDRRWADFARGYNGPGYKQNRYDEKMADAYVEFSAGWRLPSTAEIQQALNAQGARLKVDGATGPATRQAIRDFQHRNGLEVDGIAGIATVVALGLGPTHDPIAASAALNG